MNYKNIAISALYISINATLLSFTSGAFAKDANSLLGEWVYISCQGQGKAKCDNYAGFINKEYLSMKFFPNGVRVHNGDIITVKKYIFFDNIVKLDSDSAISSLQFTVNGDNMSINARNLMSSETYILTMARKGSKAATNAPATYISQQQTQPERAQVAAITQRSTGEPIIPGKQLFGTWRPDHCDYWRGTERLVDIPCKATSDSRIEFTPRTLSLNGREVAVDEYIDNSNSIDVRFQGGVQRFFVDTKKDSVAFFTDDKSNNRQLRIIAVRLSGAPVSGAVSPTPTLPETKDSAHFVLAGDIVPLK